MDLKSRTEDFIDIIVEKRSTASDDKTTEKEKKQEPEKGKNGKVGLKSDLADNNNFDAEEIDELVRRQFGKEFKFVNNQEALPPVETWFESEKW